MNKSIFKWVRNELPEAGTTVLCLTKNGKNYIADYDYKTNFFGKRKGPYFMSRFPGPRFIICDVIAWVTWFDLVDALAECPDYKYNIS